MPNKRTQKNNLARNPIKESLNNFKAIESQVTIRSPGGTKRRLSVWSKNYDEKQQCKRTFNIVLGNNIILIRKGKVVGAYHHRNPMARYASTKLYSFGTC